VGHFRKRRTVRLGKVSRKVTDAIARKIEALNTSAIMGQPPADDVATWVAHLDSTLYDKLAAVGLVRKRATMTLASFLDSYIATRSDVKKSTATVYGHTRCCLVQFFGADKPLRDITAGDADEWRIWLGEHEETRDGKKTTVTLADNTVARRCGIAKQFFRAALRKGLVLQNPFADLKAGLKRNTSRHYFISLAEAQAVLDACPDHEWRLIFALSRFGGLRCPSEHLRLRWADVDWERGRITVHSSKTEHHEGKASRVIPIFPELRPHLEAAWEQAEPGTEYVITRYRDASQNLRTAFERIIWKAGLAQWTKLFQNLRATRETELAETFPIHVVCEWIGNSAAIAAKHYLQVTDEHYQQAAQKAAHNPAQSGAVTARKGEKHKIKNPVFSEEYDTLRYYTERKVGGTGLEPVTSTV